jgi:hypothetical protein
MPETIIVRESDMFRTYSGWVINRTADTVVVAVISAASGEPVATLIPAAAIVAEVPAAA